MKIFSKSASETEKIAKLLAEKLKGNEIIALFGDLGVGKTAFTRGIAEFFGVKDLVSSPTFSIMNEYQGEKTKICHFDMYRVHSLDDLESTGFFECIGNCIVIVEWSENIMEFIPENSLKVKISKTDKECERILKIEGADLI